MRREFCRGKGEREVASLVLMFFAVGSSCTPYGGAGVVDALHGGAVAVGIVSGVSVL